MISCWKHKSGQHPEINKVAQDLEHVDLTNVFDKPF